MSKSTVPPTCCLNNVAVISLSKYHTGEIPMKNNNKNYILIPTDNTKKKTPVKQTIKNKMESYKSLQKGYHILLHNDVPYVYNENINILLCIKHKGQHKTLYT